MVFALLGRLAAPPAARASSRAAAPTASAFTAAFTHAAAPAARSLPRGTGRALVGAGAGGALAYVGVTQAPAVGEGVRDILGGAGDLFRGAGGALQGVGDAAREAGEDALPLALLGVIGAGLYVLSKEG